MTPTHPCTVCGRLETVHFMGMPQMPVHCNVLWPTPAGARQAPRGDIQLHFCPTCGHVFNADFDPALMAYDQAYENSLHFSDRFQQYATALASDLVARYGLQGKDIVEIGSGQGDFLQLLCELGQNRGVGFDPSYDPGAVRASGGQADPGRVRFVPDFYGAKYAGQPADFIVCRHVLEHIEDPAGFLRLVRGAVGPREATIVFFEVPNVLFTLRQQGIWDIIYEHCSYFSPHSLAYAFAQAGFEVLRVTETFGGQFLTIEARPVPAGNPLPTPNTSDLAADVAQFGRLYHDKVQTWQQHLDEMAQSGRRVIIWGAGSKGVSFLNTLPTQDVVAYAVDINPRKEGMHVAGSGQQIVPPTFLPGYRPDNVIIMNANYIDEIGQQLAALGLSAAILVA